jgi:hypothetical protein
LCVFAMFSSVTWMLMCGYAAIRVKSRGVVFRG